MHILWATVLTAISQRNPAHPISPGSSGFTQGKLREWRFLEMLGKPWMLQNAKIIAPIFLNELNVLI